MIIFVHSGPEAVWSAALKLIKSERRWSESDKEDDVYSTVLIKHAQWALRHLINPRSIATIFLVAFVTQI